MPDLQGHKDSKNIGFILKVCVYMGGDLDSDSLFLGLAKPRSSRSSSATIGFQASLDHMRPCLKIRGAEEVAQRLRASSVLPEDSVPFQPHS